MTFARPFPAWLMVVPVGLAIASVIGVRVARDQDLFDGLLASRPTLFAIGSALLAYKLSELAMFTWACRRYGRCTIAAEPAGGSPSLTFETPFSRKRKAIVHFEDLVERTVSSHGIRVFASRVVITDRNGGVREMNRYERGTEALLIPCAPGKETDDVLALLDAPWAHP